MLLSIKSLSKRYDSTLALNNVNLSLQEGKIIGLLGPNGSGKTTLIKVLLGLLRQYDGEVEILGSGINDATRALISYLPDKNHIPPHWSVEYAMTFFGDFFEDFSVDKARHLCDELKLESKMKIKHLSKGNQEKVALMLMLSRQARLYIFDEPIAGVDPLARDLIFRLILENYNRESSVIIATHLLLDVQKILDEAVLLYRGSVIAHRSVEELCGEYGNLDEAFKAIYRGGLGA